MQQGCNYRSDREPAVGYQVDVRHPHHRFAQKYARLPAEEFEKILDELKASRDLCREVYTGLFPAASAGTAAASRLADLDAFIEYAMVAQETASMNLSEAPTATKQSLRGRFIDLLLPETWEHVAETVTGPTLETPPHV